MEASSSKKRSRSAVHEAPHGAGNDDEEICPLEEPAATKKQKKNEADKISREKIKAKNEQTAADLEKLERNYAYLEGKYDQSEKEKQKFTDLADQLLEERREFNKLYGGNVNKITDLTEKFYALLEKHPQIFSSSMMERGSTSATAGTEVVQVIGPFQSIPADSGSIHLAHNMLKERYAASEARHVQEITALVENHAQEVAKIRMEHRQELENLRSEAWARDQNLIQYQHLNFNPDDLLNDN